MLFKILIVGGGIYLLYRWWGRPAIEGPSDIEQKEEWTEYEELD